MNTKTISACLLMASFCGAHAMSFKMPSADELTSKLEEYGLEYVDIKISLIEKLADKTLTSFEAMVLIEVALGDLQNYYLAARRGEEWRAKVFVHELWVKHGLYWALLPYDAVKELWLEQMLPSDELTRLGIEMPDDLLEQFESLSKFCFFSVALRSKWPRLKNLKLML